MFIFSCKSHQLETHKYLFFLLFSPMNKKPTCVNVFYRGKQKTNTASVSQNQVYYIRFFVILLRRNKKIKTTKPTPTQKKLLYYYPLGSIHSQYTSIWKMSKNEEMRKFVHNFPYVWRNFLNHWTQRDDICMHYIHIPHRLHSVSYENIVMFWINFVDLFVPIYKISHITRQTFIGGWNLINMTIIYQY